MGFGVRQALGPVGVQWPNLKFGDQHAHHGAERDQPGREVAFVEVDGLATARVNLSIERRGDVEMGDVGPGCLRVPVVDKQFGVIPIEKAVLIRLNHDLDSGWRLEDFSEIQPDAEAKHTPSAIRRRQPRGCWEVERAGSAGG